MSDVRDPADDQEQRLPGQPDSAAVSRCGCNAIVPRLRKASAEQSALLVRGSWYAREVHRRAVDHWQHGRMSLRRTAEYALWLGRQERWRLWSPVDTAPPGAACYLAASTVHRWLDAPAWRRRPACPGNCRTLRRVPSWGRMAVGAAAGWRHPVVLLLADSVTGLLWPPVVAAREDQAAPWQRLFERARQAGLDWQGLRGVTSDGAQVRAPF